MIFSIQTYLEDSFNRRGLGDPDQYAVNLARVYDRERAGKTEREFLAVMRRVRTAFYRRNSNLARDTFRRVFWLFWIASLKKKDCCTSQKRSPKELKNQEAA